MLANISSQQIDVNCCSISMKLFMLANGFFSVGGLLTNRLIQNTSGRLGRQSSQCDKCLFTGNVLRPSLLCNIFSSVNHISFICTFPVVLSHACVRRSVTQVLTRYSAVRRLFCHTHASRLFFTNKRTNLI